MNGRGHTTRQIEISTRLPGRHQQREAESKPFLDINMHIRQTVHMPVVAMGMGVMLDGHEFSTAVIENTVEPN